MLKYKDITRRPFSRVVADLETDGLSPSVIHMVGILDIDTGEFEDYHGEDVALGLIRLIEADLIVGQNFFGYDLPVIISLTDGLVQLDRDKIIDTLDISRQMFPELKSHSLKSWGTLIGVPKLQAPSFKTYTKEMAVYCKGDCETTLALFEFFLSQNSVLNETMVTK